MAIDTKSAFRRAMAASAVGEAVGGGIDLIGSIIQKNLESRRLSKAQKAAWEQKIKEMYLKHGLELDKIAQTEFGKRGTQREKYGFEREEAKAKRGFDYMMFQEGVDKDLYLAYLRLKEAREKKDDGGGNGTTDKEVNNLISLIRRDVLPYSNYKTKYGKNEFGGMLDEKTIKANYLSHVARNLSHYQSSPGFTDPRVQRIVADYAGQSLKTYGDKDADLIKNQDLQNEYGVNALFAGNYDEYSNWLKAQKEAIDKMNDIEKNKKGLIGIGWDALTYLPKKFAEAMIVKPYGSFSPQSPGSLFNPDVPPGGLTITSPNEYKEEEIFNDTPTQYPELDKLAEDTRKKFANQTRAGYNTTKRK